MAVTITAAGLVEAYPEWANANTDTPAVVTHVVAVVNAKGYDDLYTDTDEETARRYLEACAMLFEHAYGRDMRKPNSAPLNTYRKLADSMDALRGSAARAPGWTIPGGAV